MTLTLLPTKFQRPRLGPQTVPRQHLLERLQAGLSHGLTLLSAPAGFGKTTLVAEWLEVIAQPAREAPYARMTSPQLAGIPPSLSQSHDATTALAPLSSAERAHFTHLRTAWLTLDAHDNDPVRFWTYVAAALRGATVVVPPASAHGPALEGVAGDAFKMGLDSLLGLIQAPQGAALDAVVEDLLCALESAPGTVVLVIDDFQHIRTPAIHDSLHFFIAHLPEHAHLVLLTRADPPLPLNRWRAHGQLLELRAKDLCFSVEEAGALFSRRTKVVLPPETVATLVEYTDGWPVGLQLLAASLQGRSLREVDRFVLDLTASSRYVLDYLMEEVLQSQPEPVRDFLLRTSILGRMCAPLCDDLLDVRAAGHPDGVESVGGEPGPSGRAILNYLESHNLFLVPLDDERQWYRYYHLFSEALHQELDRNQPDMGLELHKCAARWFAAHGFMAEAIEHALAAGDWERAANDLVSIAFSMLVRGEFTTLFAWLDRLPQDTIAVRPRLAVSRAYQLLFRGPLYKVQALIELLVEPLDAQVSGTQESGAQEKGAQEKGAQQQAVARDSAGRTAPPDAPSLRGEVAALRAQLASFRWRVGETFALCDEALRWLAPQDHFSRAAVLHALAHAHLLSGCIEEAAFHYQAAIVEAMELGSIYIALFPTLRLAQTQMQQGQLRLAEQTCRRALRTALDHGGQEWPLLADIYVTLADLAREHNDLLAAEHYVRQAMALASVRGFEVYARACVVQARISLALGRRDESRAALADAMQAALDYNNPLLSQWLGAHLARLDIATGDLDAARLWASAFAGVTDRGGYLPEDEELTLARVSLAERRPRATLAALHEIEARAVQSGHVCCLIEVNVLLALCHAALNQRTYAMETLERALDLGEAEGLRRLFLDEGERLSALLEMLSERSEYAATLLGMLRGGASTARTRETLGEPLDRLTPRELEILRALARGNSNQDIAEAFVLTVGTVKGHVNHILGKLNARNRTEAVARARELGLI